MKTIIASLKAQIEATKKTIEIGESALKSLKQERDAASKAHLDSNVIETIWMNIDECRQELSKDRTKLSDLRYALVSVRKANGEDLFDIDTFAPELGC